MKNRFFYPLLLAVLTLFMTADTQAQDFVYKPKNPAFGGETFNYNWLLSSAEAQNLIENPDLDNRLQGGSDLNDFTESLNRQLLSQLSRQIAIEQFGEAGIEDGNYTIGNFQIDVTSNLEGLSITIVDVAAGDQTQIVIPFF
ncbi:MAG: curli production assembly/transport component CsgF [Bacteroidota bacterium]